VRSSSAAAKLHQNRAAHSQPEALPAIDPFRARHLALARCDIATANGRVTVTVDDSESPLAWLARRKSRDGATLIDAVQFEAGERLRADFTCAQLMPRTTSNWDAAVADGRRSGGNGAAAMTDAVVAARQRVRHALDAVGPEFSGLLLDVCCFLKGLEAVERERRWPARSAKVVLQLGLDRLARHYGHRREIRGVAKAPMRAWSADAGVER
jgi:hypothetical protein